MPLSSGTLNLKFMQRGAAGQQPAPASTKSKYKPQQPAASTSGQTIEQHSASPVASTSRAADEESTRPGSSRGFIIRKEMSLTAFPMLSPGLGVSAAPVMGSSNGRRSFGHYNKTVEALHKPPIPNSAAKGKAAAGQSDESSDSEDDDDDGSDSSVQFVQETVTAKKRPHAPPPKSQSKGFRKPVLGQDTSPRKKKRKT